MPDAAPQSAASAGHPIQAPIVFMTHDQAEKPRVMMNADHAVPNERLGTFREATVPILDARALPEPASLDVQGFALSTMPTAMADFYDEASIEAVYYPEIIDFLKRETGATDVHIFDHTVRVQDDGKRAETAKRLPVLIAHNDYTETSGPKRVRDVMDGARADRFLGHRFAMVNVWRSIGASAERTPLAVADARTMDQRDYLATDLVYQDRVGEIYQNAYSDSQDWYWYPDMGGDEVMLLKCFDTAHDGRARFTSHTGFENPNAPAGTPPRESIEVRTMISFAP
ncbi:MAG: methyltransferase [Rhodospirillaceae bacterium]|nr:methyltransferase [Rhodospirillaceae bacterium]